MTELTKNKYAAFKGICRTFIKVMERSKLLINIVLFAVKI